MKFKIEEIDFSKISDEWLEGYFYQFYKICKEDFPSYPLPNRKLRIKYLTTKNPYYQSRYWLVFDKNEKIMGYASLGSITEKNPSYESNKHLGHINISIDEKFRRQGVGTKIKNLLIEEAIKKNITTLQVWTPNPGGKAASKSWGGMMAHEHYVNKLLLKDVDWALMNKWIDDSKIKAKDVEISLFFEVPEQIIDEYVVLHTETENQAPWGGEGVN